MTQKTGQAPTFEELASRVERLTEPCKENFMGTETRNVGRALFASNAKGE